MVPGISEILPILRKASDAILDIYNEPSRFNTEVKTDNSPLTEADKQANEIIHIELSALFPDIPIIAEESKQAEYYVRKNFTSYFLVDPLDGTKEFIQRNGEFTVNIAFLEGTLVQAGFVFVPLTQTAYYAEKGKGAFRIDSQDVITPLMSKPFYLFQEGIKVVTSRSHLDRSTEKIISKLNNALTISSGSSKKFIAIAEGLANFYPRLAPTMEWDTAAAQCILEESGGGIVRASDLQPLEYNKPDLLNPHFLAFGALLDPESLSSLF